MNREMRVKGHDEDGNSVVTFMQQMIPHHLNAIEMSKILLKTASAQEIADVEDLDAHLWGIMAVQGHQVHYFRNYLAGHTGYTGVTHDGSNLDAESVGHHCDNSLATSPAWVWSPAPSPVATS